MDNITSAFASVFCNHRTKSSTNQRISANSKAEVGIIFDQLVDHLQKIVKKHFRTDPVCSTELNERLQNQLISEDCVMHLTAECSLNWRRCPKAGISNHCETNPAPSGWVCPETAFWAFERKLNYLVQIIWEFGSISIFKPVTDERLWKKKEVGIWTIHIPIRRDPIVSTVLMFQERYD